MDTENLTINLEETKQIPAETEDNYSTTCDREKDLNVVADEMTPPKILKDSTVDAIPEYVECILMNCDITRSSQSEILMALIYCIALENGYAPISELENINQYEGSWGFTYHAHNLNKLKHVSIDFKEIYDGFHKCTLFLLNVSKKRCILSSVKSGDCVFLTLSPDNAAGRSICLSLPRFVLSIKNQPFCLRLRNLKELSQILSDCIFVPVRNESLKEHNLPFPGLDGLPTLILSNIFQHLTVKELHILGQTGWELRNEVISYYIMKYKPFTIPYSKN